MISTRQIKLVRRKTEKATNGSGGKAYRAALQEETDRCSHRWGGANSRSTRRDGTDNSEGGPDSRRAAKYLKHCGWSWNDGPEVWPAEGGLPRGRFLLRDIRGPPAGSGKASSEKPAGRGPTCMVGSSGNASGMASRCHGRGAWPHTPPTPRSAPWPPLAKPLEVRVLLVAPGTAETCTCRGRRGGSFSGNAALRAALTHVTPHNLHARCHTRANDQEPHAVGTDLRGPCRAFSPGRTPATLSPAGP